MSVVIYTGAGISVASGLPTFRGVASDGTWESDPDWTTYVPHKLDALWEVFGERRRQALSVEPNAAHIAISGYGRSPATTDGELTVITQNIDDLHSRAGTTDVIELHGNITRSRCVRNKCSTPSWRDDSTGGSPCPRCGRRSRPDVVFFGESLRSADWRRASRAVRRCDILIAVGTSGLVYPAAGLLDLVPRDARRILVNAEHWEDEAIFDDVHVGNAEDVLPGILDDLAAPD